MNFLTVTNVIAVHDKTKIFCLYEEYKVCTCKVQLQGTYKVRARYKVQGTCKVQVTIVVQGTIS